MKSFVPALLAAVLIIMGIPTSSPAAAPTTNLSITVVTPPTPPPVSGNTMAGCPMYQSDMHISRDITTATVSSNSAADISAESGWGNLGSMGTGIYLLHILANGPSEPQTYPQMSTGHTNPGNLPIGQYTNANALTNGAGDASMEIIAHGYTSGNSTGHVSANGCMVVDGYSMQYIGTNGVYSPTNMWKTYSSCYSDPSQNMIAETCNSNASLSGIEIAAGMFPEQITSTQPSGWSTLDHALLVEDPCNVGPNQPICENNSKMRLRVCGQTDYTNPGTNCINMPSQSSHPQAYKVVYALEHYGLLNSDNGCCFNLLRNYPPQSGDPDINYSDINAIITTINIRDFDVLASNN